MIGQIEGHRSRARQIGWAAAFLAILAALLFPVVIVSAHYGHPLSVTEQACIVAVATIVVQSLRRKSLWEVTGRPNLFWLRDCLAGVVAGALLMLLPAVFLLAGGWVAFEPAGTDLDALSRATLLMAGVAIAEELLFRGVLFQRLIDGIGVWPAQLAVAALFTLTHMGNPGMEGATKFWAGINIFVASLLFGLAYIQTRSLALPIGLHFMANTTQGIVLGFGVSGEEQASLLNPTLSDGSIWMTGGAFGLEASLPGLVVVTAALWVTHAGAAQLSPGTRQSMIRKPAA